MEKLSPKVNFPMQLVAALESKFLAIQNYFSNLNASKLVLIFVVIRVLSFYTYFSPIANGLIALFLIVGFGYICTKKISTAWIILIAELLLDGAGHFFELQGLILRTWFLGMFALVWLVQKIRYKKIELQLPRYLLIGLIAVSIAVAWAVINAFLKGHPPLLILQDAILYGFLFLVFPALEFQEETLQKIPQFIKVFIIGSATFSLITFFKYSSGMGYIHDLYYHWFRNTAGGKITDLGNDFFRIVLPEHLFIIPLLLIITSLLITDLKNKKLWIYLVLSSIILSLNFSRIYFLALAGGFLVLALKNSIKKWFIACTVVSVTIVATFSVLFFMASRGNSIGLELLGLKAGGAVAPTSEASGAIRLAILPDALRTIKEHPLLGSGLGTTISYVDPITKETVSRTQFDWGYLELFAELGIIGGIIFLFFLLSILYSLAHFTYRSHNSNDPHNPLIRGLIAGGISVFAINLTTPALFQGFGVLYFVLLLVIIQKLSNKKA